MEIIKKDTGELQATIIAKIQEADYAERVEKELKKVRKTANIKGFRPGQVPLPMVKKMFGKEIISQEVSKYLDEELKKYFNKNKIEIIGDILPSKTEETKFDVVKDKDFQFAFDLGFFPEIKINLEELKIPEYKITVEEKQIDEEIKKLADQNGEFIDAEEVEAESNIRATIIELNKDKTVKEDGIKVEEGLVLIKYLDEKTATKFIGSKKEDKIIVNVKKAFKSEADLAGLLKIDKEKLSDINDNFEFTITQIQNFKKSEINQEFFDKLFGKDKVKSEEEMRNKIREMIENQYKAETKVRFRYDFRDKLKETVEMPLPDDFIVLWQLDRRKNETEETIRKDLDSLKDFIKWDKIISVLAKEHNLEITEKDLLDSSKANIINQITQMGLSTNMFTDEQLDQFASQELEKLNDNDRYYLIFSTMERKVLDGLYEKVQKEEKEISFDELKAIYDEENKKIAESTPKKEEEKEQKEENN